MKKKYGIYRNDVFGDVEYVTKKTAIDYAEDMQRACDGYLWTVKDQTTNVVVWKPNFHDIVCAALNVMIAEDTACENTSVLAEKYHHAQIAKYRERLYEICYTSTPQAMYRALQSPMLDSVGVEAIQQVFYQIKEGMDKEFCNRVNG